MCEKEKKFLMPEAVFVTFMNDDIITESEVSVSGDLVPEDGTDE